MRDYKFFFTLIIFSITITGCEFLGDIFRAGIWVGIIIVVIIIAIIFWLVKKFR
jgi:hypothetical protein